MPLIGPGVSRPPIRYGEGRAVDFQAFLQRQMQGKQFAELWEETRPSFDAGALLIKIRAELDLTQNELAERVGVKRSYISRIESGDGNPTVRTLGRILSSVGFRLKLEAYGEEASRF